MRTLASFRAAHAGKCLLVCGCGESLNLLDEPGRFVTIGVNDVGRKFDPHYLVVVDPPANFKGDRFAWVASSRARHLFTQRDDLGFTHPGEVRFRLGRRDGTDFSDPEVLDYGVTTPYVAVCLAIHMGAVNVGLIGIDFTDNHFFGATGIHPWTPHLATVDAQFARLAQAAAAAGVRLFNLSPSSRLTAVPRMRLETFAGLAAAADATHAAATHATPGPAADAGKPPAPARQRVLRIVSYSTMPVVGVPMALARCINDRTGHSARCVWSAGSYGNGTRWPDDLEWKTQAAQARRELESADLVIVHNGKVDPAHAALIARKPVLTMAHNYLANVDTRWVQAGFPGVVVGQYQSTLLEFQGWTRVPNPLPWWEPEYRAEPRGAVPTVAYTPAGTHGVHPPGHPLHWHSKGYDETLAILDGLARDRGIRLEVVRDGFVPHARSMAMKRAAHIVIDECVTGSYHRNSLEGLAAGCVVVNAVGALDGVAQAMLACTRPTAVQVPFVRSGLTDLRTVLGQLLDLGTAELEERGRANRAWMERHWDFAQQWEELWWPAVERSLQQAAGRRPQAARNPAGPSPIATIVVATRNEGELLRRTVQGLLDSTPAEVEIVVVDDGSQDGSADGLRSSGQRVRVMRLPSSAGCAAARNAGAAAARGTLLVFCDAHVALSPGWLDAISPALADPDVGMIGPAVRSLRWPQDFDTGVVHDPSAGLGYGLCWQSAELRTGWLGRRDDQPHDVPLLSGSLLCIRRNLFAAVGGYDAAPGAAGAEDAELCLRLWRLGYRCLVHPGVTAAHLFRAGRTYPLAWEPVLYGRLRLCALHFDAARRQQVVEALRGHPGFAAALARLDADDSRERSERLAALAAHDDDEFFTRFAACGWTGTLTEKSA